MDSYYSNKMSYGEFFGSIMKWMTVALGITTITSFLFSFLHLELMLGASYFIFMIVCSIIEIGLVIMLSKTVKDMAIEKAKTYYIAYSVINGIVLSMWLNYVVPGVAVLAFAVTAVYFGLLYTVTQHTNNNFIGIGKVCLMALPVLMIAYILLIFISAPGLYYLVVFLDLAVFTGLTLYDFKHIEYAYEVAPQEALQGVALLCALQLYMDFINIFIDILMLVSDNN